MFNLLLKGEAVRDATESGFFGTNTGSAVPAQFRFGQVVAGTGMSRERGLELLLASQGGAFGRTAGLGYFEIFPGLFTQADVFQRSDIQMPYRDLETHRRMKLQEKALRFGRQHGALFGQGTLGQGGFGRGISQDTIDLLIASQGPVDGRTGTGLQFDSAGNLTSASGLLGFTSKTKLARNRLALLERKRILSARDAFLNSEAFLEQQQIRTLFGGRIAPLGRTIADIAARGGGLKSGKGNRLLLAEALTGGELGRRLGISNTFQPFGSTDHIFGAFNELAGGRNFGRLLRATGAFLGRDPKRLFVDDGRASRNPAVAKRLQEFGVRVLEGRPIFVEDVLPFVQKSKGITQERLLEALQTLDPQSFERDVRLEQNLGALDLAIEKAREEGVASIYKKSGGKRRFSDLLRAQSRLQERITTPSAVRKAFRADIIDTRNEILELEAKAYFIEREEANSVA